jgi:hypothetical protein
MQIGSRFTEYGLTGGFFWICQLLYFTYTGQAKILLSNLASVDLDIPSWILQIGSPAITALAIIAVFVAGLLLDLSAVYFRQWEMSVFHRHLIRNRDWLGRLIADHKGYCEADYEEFERQFDKSSRAKDTKVEHANTERAIDLTRLHIRTGVISGKNQMVQSTVVSQARLKVISQSQG